MKNLKKRILITGGGGYIGAVMTKYFLGQGYQVRVLDRLFFGEDVFKECGSSRGLEIFREDIRYCSDEVFHKVDYAIDLASLSNDPSADLDPKLTTDININGAIRFAKMAKVNGVQRYVYASSCSVYGKNPNPKLTEKSRLLPISLYARSKVAVEKALIRLADSTFIVTIGRNATCYGLSPRMRFDLAVNIITKTAYQENTVYITGGGNQWRPLVHIKDVARAYQSFLESPINKVQKQIFNVGSNNQNYQMLDLAKIIQRNFDNSVVKHSPGNSDTRDYNVSFDKITKVLGYKSIETVDSAVKEIKQALEKEMTTTDIRSNTVAYYKYLLETDQKLQKLRYNGKIL